MANQHSDTRIAPTAPDDPSPDRATDIGVGQGLSVWPVAQRSAAAQRRGRLVTGSCAHPARMLPHLTAHAIQTHTAQGDIMLDPLICIGTTLVEAVHAGRNAVGVEVESGWAALAEAHIALARAHGVAGFASRLALRLVEVCTDPHDIAADFGGDPHLHTAAHAKARSYRAITGPTQLADLDTPRSQVTLLVWRWPRPTAWPTKSITLFAACHLIMARSGRVVAAVRSAEPGRPGASHAEHMARLLPAAQDAGFRHVLQIVAVGGGGDARGKFVYYATSDEAAHAARDPAAGARVPHRPARLHARGSP